MCILNLSTPKRSEIELRVAQELRNNQQFIYQTNQSIQDITRQIDSESLDNSMTKAKLESDHKRLEIKFENLEKKVLEECDSTCHQIADFATALIDLTNELVKKFSDVYETYASVKQVEDLSQRLEKEVASLQTKIFYERGHVDSAINLLKGELDAQNSSIREDFKPIVPEVDPIQEAVDERLNPLEIDFKGLVKEIELLKRSAKYNDKRYEQLLTLIERSKER